MTSSFASSSHGTRVYVTFNSDEAGKFEVATVELDTSDRTRHPGVVKTRMFETPERPASFTIKLDKPYHDYANVVARAAVTKAALQRGFVLNLRVYVIFNTSKDRFMKVDAVERRYE
ncbi:hypothetical protein HO133_008911 [Letharia lupina]|uniref:Uncharacterized protein n=1 Tax=Letharia lupina TaxID=560253 RepID=A0A8H6FGA6_9LECA|nr:uncharacterized protein HO133_008911 [Letharia lupina]KAF6227467.1 hypothetical protein HO133_008911 [Letharia lupina]